MKHTYQIRLADTDAAGRIYFTSACRIAHESFEQFMDTIGFDLNTVIHSLDFGLPIVHLEATYKMALVLGQTVTIETVVEELGKRSVTFSHLLSTSSGDAAVLVTITHAVVSKKSGKSIMMPARLKKALSCS